MFTPSLDHLHILVMLILAFFSFRAYNSNTLAIEYEPQQEKVEQSNQQEENRDEPQVEEKAVGVQEMSEEGVQRSVNLENSPVEVAVQSDSKNSIDVENVNSDNVQSDLPASQNKHNEDNTVQGSLDRIDDESVVVTPSEALEKEDDQESTLLNRIEGRFSQEACDEEENAECSSSSDDSSNSSSSGFPGSDEEEKVESRREKRKRIQKAKRVQKKLRREQHRVENPVEFVEIQ